VLDRQARVEEIARMLGGTTITERTREHAREMLESAGEPAVPDGAAGNGAQRAASRASPGAGKPRGRSGRAGSASDR
jgi:hypothetical protein